MRIGAKDRPSLVKALEELRDGKLTSCEGDGEAPCNFPECLLDGCEGERTKTTKTTTKKEK